MIELSGELGSKDQEFKVDCCDALSCILPDNYKYVVNKFSFVERSKVAGESLLTCTFRVNVSVEADIFVFLENFSKKSGTSYNIEKADVKGTGKKVIRTVYRKCIHKVRRHHLKDDKDTHKGPGRQPGSECVPGKDTACEAKLKCTLSASSLHSSRRYKNSLTNSQKENYPLEVTLDYLHNHSINAADALRYRPVTDEVKEKFKQLFQQDYTPSSALVKYKDDIITKLDEKGIPLTMADRSQVPDYFWVFHYYAKYIENTYGTINGVDAYLKAVEKVKEYNERNNEELAKIIQTDDGETVVAICDHFCRRVHEHLPQAGDIVLVDATSNLDRQDTKLFHFICPSPAGGLPLGSVICSRENEETVRAGFDLLKTLLPPKAFFGRGDQGPKIFMTDDSQAEQNSLRFVWPSSMLLLCIFHLLQALWRWEWNSDNKIEKNDRPSLFNLFKGIVYAKTEDEYKDAVDSLTKGASKYPQFIKHVNNSILPKRAQWAMSDRVLNNLATHSVNTTNYVEVSFRLTKDNQFSRMKAYNLPDLLDIILDDSTYYVNRCLDIGNNRLSQFQNAKSRYMSSKCSIDPTKIQCIDQYKYSVPSERVEGKTYHVDMELSVCECSVGKHRGPCKHKHLVAKYFKLLSPDLLPAENPHIRAFYHFLGTGKTQESPWYRPLNQPKMDDIPNSTDVFSFMRDVPPPNNQFVDPNINNSQESSDQVVQEEGEFTEECEEILENFENAMDDFKQLMEERLTNDPGEYSKCLKSFTNQLLVASRASHEVLKTSLCNFIHDESLTVRRGRRKSARVITIQKTSKSRRLYQIRGSKTAPKGRPKKDIVRPKSKELQYSCLPKQTRKRKKPLGHNMSDAVKKNRPCDKKH